MATIKNEAETYNPPTTKNITELEKVSVNIETRDETYTNKEGEEFTVMKITIDNEDYRIPKSVLMQLKELLKEIPNLKHFKVTSSGSGLNTNYTTIPLPLVE